ncbi:MAG: tRNA pseudouridine(55) synthase TruB [Pseudomonadota bacterium]
MGRRRRSGQDIHGIILLDKPVGLSSNAALQRARRALDANKAGHTGSLDPFASGMLPVCLGNATRFSQFLLDADKTYRAEAGLGVATSTGDPEGEETDRQPLPDLNPDLIEAAAATLRGPIRQRPPMYSALKHQGKRLYELARRGEVVDRPLRDVVIHELKVELTAPDTLALEVRCSKGTYIRTLVEDLAKALHTVAHTRALRRLEVGAFRGKPMISLDQVEQTGQAPLLPVDAAIRELPRADLSEEQTRLARHGQLLALPCEPDGSPWRLYSPAGEFLGLARASDQGLAPFRMIATS